MWPKSVTRGFKSFRTVHFYGESNLPGFIRRQMKHHHFIRFAGEHFPLEFNAATVESQSRHCVV